MAYKSLAGTHGAYNETWVDNNYSGTEVEVASGWKIYGAAKWRGKYPPLGTDNEVNTCFSIY